MIRENGGFGMFKMIEVEKYPCKDKREAERREDEIMKELKASMNTYKSFRTDEERKEYEKQYREDIKETIQEYYETNKEKLQEYKKEYQENNKEKIQEYDKEYYETHKDMIRERINSKITCKCGSVIIRNSIKRHETTKKYINLMNPIQ